jgi:hypothetical protein
MIVIDRQSLRGQTLWRKQMPDYTAAVYEYLGSLGGPGDEVRTAIRPWLEKKYSLTYREAAHARAVAMQELRAPGRVERLNTRGAYVRILK